MLMLGQNCCLQLYFWKNSESATQQPAWQKMLAPTEGKAASFDQGTHASNLFRSSKGPV